MVFAMKPISNQPLVLNAIVSIIYTTFVFCFVCFCIYAALHIHEYIAPPGSDPIPVTPYAVSFAREHEIVLEEPILVNFDKRELRIEISGDSYYRDIDSEYVSSGYAWDEKATRYFAEHLFPEGGRELSVVLYGGGVSLKLRMERFYNHARTPYLAYSSPDSTITKIECDRIKIVYDGDVELRNVRVIWL